MRYSPIAPLHAIITQKKRVRMKLWRKWLELLQYMWMHAPDNRCLSGEGGGTEEILCVEKPYVRQVRLRDSSRPKVAHHWSLIALRSLKAFSNIVGEKTVPEDKLLY